MQAITEELKDRISTVIFDNEEYIKEYDTIAEYLLDGLDAGNNHSWYFGFDIEQYEPEQQSILIALLEDYILCEYSYKLI